jgi:hypothetical protein
MDTRNCRRAIIVTSFFSTAGLIGLDVRLECRSGVFPERKTEQTPPAQALTGSSIMRS